MRRRCKSVKVGSLIIGGNSPITVQSMLNVPSYDVEKNMCQALELEDAGCEIIRVAVPNMESVKLIYALKEKLKIPVVADIHLNYKLAIESVVAGVDKVRINPGNIGSEENVKAVAKACGSRGIPIRIGVNSGSMEKEILKKYGTATPQAMCESALYNASLLEKYDFDDIIISMKSSDVKSTIEAYRLISEKCEYPLHIGVTESGTERMGLIKSSCGIGSLLLDGIGDTVRVSLTANPLNEVHAGIDILKALGIRKDGVEFISCPTCGRTRIDIIKLANEAEKALANCKKNIKIAVMGCVVNGPGEARDADIGITGGNGIGIIFKKDKIIKRVPEENLLEELIKEVEKM